MSTPPVSDLYVGLTNLTLADSPIDLGEGLLIRKSYARFLSSFMLVNTEKEKETWPIRPSFWKFGGKEADVTAELLIPNSAGATFEARFELARLLVFLLHLRISPSIGMHVLSDHEFSSLIEFGDNERPIVIPIETRSSHYNCETSDDAVSNHLLWIKDNWKVFRSLYGSSTEFRLAVDALLLHIY